MPSCFALYDKLTGKQMVLQEVDKAICVYMDIPVSETDWAYSWYNTIGLSLAIGHDWEKIKEFFPERTPIIDFLKENYDVNSWKEFK